MAENADVIIVGAGPAGLATAACLSKQSISSVILEKENVAASLWKRRAYDRLKLHLAKEFCELPHMAFPKTAPTFVPKDAFIKYLDDYVRHFELSPRYSTLVESAVYDEASEEWRVISRSTTGSGSEDRGSVKEYVSRFLVVATGENSQGLIPDLPGLGSFTGEAVHSLQYKSGASYAGKRVIVVGSGNSGMEIAYDLANHGAKTTIAVRNACDDERDDSSWNDPDEVSPCNQVDSLLVKLTKIKYGDLAKYGIVRPDKGPLDLKATTGRSAVIDVGTVEKIQNQEVKVVKDVAEFKGYGEVAFEDGKSSSFDVVVFATGYKSTVNNWLRDGGSLFKEDGFPKKKFPNHWKGENWLYCAGFARKGLDGISNDAQLISDSIKMLRDN